MLRFVNICLVLGLVALAYVIYEVKYEARALDVEIAGLRKDIDAERDAVAVLRAEWSLLNRPERIERLAEKYLKLAPARPGQVVILDTLKESDFEWTALMAKAESLRPDPATLAKATQVKTVKTLKAAAPGSAMAKTAQAVPTEAAAPGGPAAKPKAKAPILATSALPPVTVSAPGE